MDQRSLFGLTEHLAALSKHGDPLEVLDATVVTIRLCQRIDL